MLIGPPWPTRAVEISRTVESGVPAGNMLPSRGSAMLHGVSHTPSTGVLMITGGKLGSWGTVLVECRCLKALIVATGSSCRRVTISEPGIDPLEVTETQFTVVPSPKMRAASSCMLSHVSGEAKIVAPVNFEMYAALSA